MLRTLLATRREPAPALARIALALAIMPHAAQHVLGLLGGYGFTGTLGWMTGTLGFPTPLAVVGLVTEFVAPLLLLVGLGGRFAAAGIFGLMIGAASTHLSNGFFMNWFGALKPGAEGFEYHLVVMALSTVVAIEGSGAWSLDRRLTRSTSATHRGARIDLIKARAA